MNGSLERSNVACAVRPTANCANKKSPRDYFKQQISVDSMVFTPEGLRHLVAELGASRVVFGILSGNLTKLLRISSN